MFQKRLQAGWGDMDFNSHMRNTAYLDKSADVRMMYFAEHEFPMSECIRLKIGPVIMKDEMEYFREVQFLEELNVDLTIAGLAEDGSRLVLRNTFFRSDGKLLARVTSAMVRPVCPKTSVGSHVARGRFRFRRWIIDFCQRRSRSSRALVKPTPSRSVRHRRAS